MQPVLVNVGDHLIDGRAVLDVPDRSLFRGLGSEESRPDKPVLQAGSDYLRNGPRQLVVAGGVMKQGRKRDPHRAVGRPGSAAVAARG